MDYNHELFGSVALALCVMQSKLELEETFEPENASGQITVKELETINRDFVALFRNWTF